MKSKTKITIGIPAYNEELSILNILTSVKNQTITDYAVVKIVVYSDGSRDNTDAIVKGLKDKKIQLAGSQKQNGKTNAIKEMLKIATKNGSEFLILIDADIKVKNNDIFTKLYQKINSNKRIFAVSGFAAPLKPASFAEKVGYFGFMLWENMIAKSGNKEMYFRSSDPLIILRVKEFNENRVKHYSYMHDEFYYLFAKKHKGIFAFEKKALAYFQLPKTLEDYTSQMTRYISNHISSKEHKLLKHREVRLSTSERLKAFISNLNNDYSIAISYLFIQLYLHIMIYLKSNNFNNKWSQIKSTK